MKKKKRSHENEANNDLGTVLQSSALAILESDWSEGDLDSFSRNSDGRDDLTGLYQYNRSKFLYKITQALV